MKIALDLRRIKNSGIGRYMKCLAEAVVARAPEHDFLLILPSGACEVVGFEDRQVEIVTASSKYYSLREQVELPRLLRRHKVDVLHSPHFNIPVARTCPIVVTVHDVIYLACRQDLPSRLGRLYYRAMMAAAVRRSERVLTVSEFSKNDIVRYLNADPEKIEVVFPAVDPAFELVTDRGKIEAVLSRYRLDEDYILYAGIYRPRKNHAGLLRAFRQFLKSGAQGKLVLAGPLAEGEAELLRLASELGVANKVVVTGFVPDSDLPALYSAARVYACPSLYEGFGFTVLEAMACAVPVVCSPATSLPEVAGEAALYAEAQDPEEFATALERAFFEPELRQKLIEKGLKNCRRFSWQSAADATLAVYQRAAGLPVKKAVCA
jgi:glycosyltransferase involved in cell wall biosynthesis